MAEPAALPFMSPLIFFLLLFPIFLKFLKIQILLSQKVIQILKITFQP